MKKILVVDDDRILLRMLGKTFDRYAERFEYVTACDGQEAIVELGEEAFDLVVTDIQMPRVNGLMLLAYIHTYHSAIPCMIMTSYATSRIKAKLPKRVLRAFQKPFNAEDLALAIVAALDRKEPHSLTDVLPVVSFLEMIEMEGISCVFEVDTPGMEKGSFYFENGILLDAQCGDLQGEAAALDIIGREISAHTFQDLPSFEIRRRIRSDLQDLIRNAVVDDPEIEIPLF